ncbi:MAG: hypothetical protein J6W59_05955 [Bacteroidales bacterium]|nr:hypothetical protein [Bacteroidales bacterium]
MRNQTSNQRTIYYANHLGIVDVYDEYGYRTGETADGYTTPEKLRINVSTAKGEAEAEAFGLYLDYDRILFTTNMDCPIKEGSRIWFQKDPAKEPHNYIVIRKADSKNALRYAVKQVDVGGVND